MKLTSIRAWSPLSGKMRYSDRPEPSTHFIRFDNEGFKLYEKVTVKLSGVITEGFVEDENAVFMFPTPYADIHGDPIFENDIISKTVGLSKNFGKTPTGRFSTTHRLIHWVEESWGSRVLKSDHLVVGSVSTGIKINVEDSEIIGNLFETPELMSEVLP